MSGYLFWCIFKPVGDPSAVSPLDDAIGNFSLLFWFDQRLRHIPQWHMYGLLNFYVTVVVMLPVEGEEG